MATVTVIDWEATAACVQAIGSVAAILAAVWIDRGSARRAREDREADARALRSARFDALQAVVAHLTNLKTRIEALPPAHHAMPLRFATKPVAAERIKLERASALIERFEKGPAGTPSLMAAIIRAKFELVLVMQGMSKGGRGLTAMETGQLESQVAASINAVNDAINDAANNVF